jgi:FlgD Ig-like domain/Trypsin
MFKPCLTTIIALLCLYIFPTAVAVAAEAPLASPSQKQASRGDVSIGDTATMSWPDDRVKPAGPLGRIVTRDLRTGEVTYRENVTREDFLAEHVSPGGVGSAMLGSDVPSYKNFTWWDEIDDPTIGTRPMHLKVRICWDPPCGESRGGCSGTLIDPMHVITAGHCVYSYDEDHPGWAEEITVHPGYDHGDGPWGSARAVQLHAWEGWTVDNDAHHDIAILDLDRPIGALVGWRSYGYNDDCDWYYGGGWVHRAYPQEPPYDGESMFENGGSFDECWSSYELDLHAVFWDNPTWGGASGCGGVRDGVVWAIFRGSDREDSSDSALLTDWKFNGIGVIRLEDMPSTPDLMPIYVQAEGLTLESGDPFTSFTFELVSYSRMGVNTNVICDIYMSTDKIINTNDVWLEDVSIPVSLQAMSSQTVSVSPLSVPVTTGPGRYYLGVILNYGDVNQGNNTTAAVELDSIYVACPLPSAPLITSPLNGEVCQTVSRTIDWMDLPNIETYELRVGTWCGGGSVYDAGSTSQYTVSGLDNGTTYYASVRAKTYCGSWGNWGACVNFSTMDIPTSDVSFLTPPTGDACQDSTLVSIAWSIVPGATGYELRVGESCGSGGTYPLSSSTPFYDVTNLSGGTTYQYQVRVMGNCGNWGDWSACRTFSTLPGIFTIPVGIYPPDGYACASADHGMLNWNPPGYPCTYEVEWGASCRMDTSTVVSMPYILLPPLEAGTWFWHVRALHACEGESAWSTCWSFDADGTPPEWPGYLESMTHETSTWSGVPVVTTFWEDATDDCFVEYRIVWDHLPYTVPDSLAQAIPDVTHDSEPLPDGDDHWVHVLAKDVPGNLAINPQHLGPFWIDTSAPSVQVLTPVGGQTFAEGQSVSIAWAAVDPHSGVDTALLHYTIDAETTWQYIATITDPLITTYGWTVPEAVTDSARVRVTMTDVAGNTGAATNERWFSIGPSSGVGEPGSLARFALVGNFPNPFNPSTTIRYLVPDERVINLRIYDATGRFVRDLLRSERVSAGRHDVEWDGRDEAGRSVPTGVYFYRLSAGLDAEFGRMVLVK